MSKIIILSCLMLASLATGRSAHAAYPSLQAIESGSDVGNKRVRNQLSVRPLSLVLGQVGLDYERKLGARTSLVVTPSLDIASFGLEFEELNLKKAPTTALGGSVAVRFWPGQEALAGVFVEPFAGYTHALGGEIDSRRGPAHFNGSHTLTGGTRLGYQWVLPHNVVLTGSAGVAVGYTRSSTTVVGLRMTDNFTKVRPDAQLNLGYAF